MSIPIIKYSDKFLKFINPFIPIIGIGIFPFIILKERFKKEYYESIKKTLINHESIHIEQQKELLVLPFYVLYILEWFIKLFFYGTKAYRNLSFEREANKYENDFDYINNRKRYAFIKYIFKS